MDLEIADYERTVSGLNATIQEKDALVAEQKSEIERLEKRTEVLQNEIGEVTNGGSSLKQLVDYEHTVSGLKATIQEKDALVAEQKTEIERLEKRTEVLQNEIGEVTGAGRDRGGAVILILCEDVMLCCLLQSGILSFNQTWLKFSECTSEWSIFHFTFTKHKNLKGFRTQPQKHPRSLIWGKTSVFEKTKG